jgi:hypothetical protein
MTLRPEALQNATGSVAASAAAAVDVRALTLTLMSSSIEDASSAEQPSVANPIATANDEYKR